MLNVDNHEKHRREVEFDRFKKQIDLVQFIEATSEYRVVQNSGLYARLRGSDRTDEVVVTRKSDGVWVWCDPRNVMPRAGRPSDPGPAGVHSTALRSGDQGSIIDFVRLRLSGPQNLGEVRKELRKWTGSCGPAGTSTRPAPSLQPTKEPDRTFVASQLAASPIVTSSQYLHSRGLRPEVPADPRFARCIHQHPSGEVRFPHRDRQGITGFERKSPTFSGFAAGGTRALWCSRALPSDRRLVVSEATIECLSFHQLHPHAGTRYLSTGGSISFVQADLLRSAFTKMPAGSTLVIATNNDPPRRDGKPPPGELMATIIREIAQEANPSLEIARPIPPVGKDWNDTLKDVEKVFIQSLSTTHVPRVRR